MRWTAARTRLLPLLAPSVAGHVGLVLTRYRKGWCIDPGRGTISWDAQEVAVFDTARYWTAHEAARRDLQHAGLSFEDAYDRARDELEAAGILGHWRFEQAVEAYPELAIEAALAHPDPIIRAFAMLDRRLGKRRLVALADASDLPFVRRLWALRCEAEGLVTGRAA